MNRIREAIESARRERDEREIAWQRQHLEFKRSMEELDAAFQREAHKFRPATPSEYAAWLMGFLEQGGSITHPYPYPMPSGRPSGFMVVKSDAVLPPLYGSRSIEIIVPVGRSVTFPKDRGHINVFWMDGFRHEGHFVPSYPDVEALLT